MQMIYYDDGLDVEGFLLVEGFFRWHWGWGWLSMYVLFSCFKHAECWYNELRIPVGPCILMFLRSQNSMFVYYALNFNLDMSSIICILSVLYG